jgi:hypothetical protein
MCSDDIEDFSYYTGMGIFKYQIEFIFANLSKILWKWPEKAHGHPSLYPWEGRATTTEQILGDSRK